MKGHPERYNYFALAEKLGMTVRELLRSMTSADITEWLAYFKVKHAFEEQELNSRK